MNEIQMVNLALHPTLIEKDERSSSDVDECLVGM